MTTSTMIEIQVLDDVLDPEAEQRRLREQIAGAGALVAFVGLMRDRNLGDAVEAMELEHYPGMTERALQEIAEQAAERWTLSAIHVSHRVGRLLPNDPIVLVAVTSAHRREAFEACEFLMDFLKTQAPFWKKEFTAEGARWVEARETDQQAANRWRDHRWLKE